MSTEYVAAGIGGDAARATELTQSWQGFHNGMKGGLFIQSCALIACTPSTCWINKLPFTSAGYRHNSTESRSAV
jgi:hypothetical protein